MTETDTTGHALVMDMVSDGVMLVYHPAFRIGSFDRWGASPRYPLHTLSMLSQSLCGWFSLWPTARTSVEAAVRVNRSFCDDLVVAL